MSQTQMHLDPPVHPGANATSEERLKQHQGKRRITAIKRIKDAKARSLPPPLQPPPLLPSLPASDKNISSSTMVGQPCPLPWPSPQVASYSLDPMASSAMARQLRFQPTRGGAGDDAFAGGGHQGAGANVHGKDHSFPLTHGADVECQETMQQTTTTATSAGIASMSRSLVDATTAVTTTATIMRKKQKVSSSTAKRKESEVKQRKEPPTKRLKSPAGPISPLIPARSTGIRMMLSSPRLSPRLISPSTSLANSPPKR